MFVEQMMRWPATWPDLKPLETDKTRSWLQQHGKYYATAQFNMDAQGIKQVVIQNLESELNQLFTNGRTRNNKFYIGNINGEKGESLTVNLSGQYRGNWKDWATGEGGDIFSLIMSVKGLSFSDALEDCRRRYGITEVKTVRKARPKGYPRERSLAKASDSPVLRYLNDRGISTETCKLYRIRKHPKDDAIAFQYVTPDGHDAHAKYIGLKRDANGKKRVWSTPPHMTLWGWWLVDDNTRSIAITEGEIDAMTLSQIDPKMPVLSMPSGTKVYDWIANDYERLQHFEKIYVVTDSDASGDESAEQICNRLGQTRCARIPVPDGYNDVNEAWNGGDESVLEWSSWEKGATYYTPETIRAPSDYLEDAKKVVDQLKLASIRNNFIFPSMPFRFRDGELTIISGEPGHGKSQWLYQSHIHEMLECNKTFIVSMEIPPKKMLVLLSHVMIGYFPEHQSLERCLDWLDHHLVFHSSCSPKDPEKTVTRKELLGDMDYAHKRFGVKRFVIDSLHFLVGKDDYEGQDTFTRSLRRFVDRTQTHVSLVAHANIKQRNEKQIPGKHDVEGSGGMMKPIDNGLTIWRNSEKQDRLDNGDMGAAALHDGIIKVWKQRETGEEFQRKLWFDKFSKTFRERPDNVKHFFQDREFKVIEEEITE